MGPFGSGLSAVQGAVADVGTHLHAVELHLTRGGVGGLLGGGDGFAEADDAEDAAAGDDRQAFFVEGRAGVEDHLFGGVFRQLFDDGALFGVSRVAAGGADDGTVPNRRDKQGLFKMDGYFLALAPRPGDAQYKWSARGSKYDSPTAAFCEKTINEYCLLSPGGEAEALASVKYAEALRGCMVQLYKNDMRVNLPAPLHLAEQVEEYIWDWELTGRR